jgi:hypothetical protein
MPACLLFDFVRLISTLSHTIRELFTHHALRYLRFQEQVRDCYQNEKLAVTAAQA